MGTIMPRPPRRFNPQQPGCELSFDGESLQIPLLRDLRGRKPRPTELKEFPQ